MMTDVEAVELIGLLGLVAVYGLSLISHWGDRLVRPFGVIGSVGVLTGLATGLFDTVSGGGLLVGWSGLCLLPVEDAFRADVRIKVRAATLGIGIGGFAVLMAAQNAAYSARALRLLHGAVCFGVGASLYSFWFSQQPAGGEADWRRRVSGGLVPAILMVAGGGFAQVLYQSQYPADWPLYAIALASTGGLMLAVEAVLALFEHRMESAPASDGDKLRYYLVSGIAWGWAAWASAVYLTWIQMGTLGAQTVGGATTAGALIASTGFILRFVLADDNDPGEITRLKIGGFVGLLWVIGICSLNAGFSSFFGVPLTY